MVETAATIEIEPEPERLAPGSLVGDYEVERFLGAGAMGQVYAGKHPVIGKRVAIKVLRREMAAEPDAAIRFIREARAANQVAHPNVIDIFAFGTLPDGRLYLVMDLVDGQSLRAIIRDGTLDLAGSLAILAQIAEALDAAHAKGVVHRDLKPDNVMVADGGKVFVLDFGLAKLVQVGTGSAVGTGTLTARGTWIGTPGYMAPEQWSADGAVPASDRYALGVIAFELLSGKLPFAAPSLPAMMEQHFRAPVPALSSKGTVNASAAFDPVLARAMAKNPEARFASAHAFVEALRDAAAGKLFRFPSQRRPWIPAGAAIGVLGLGVVGVLAVRGRGGTSAREADPPPPRTTYRVDVITQPAGARLSRGETQLGMTPFPLDLAPGERAQIDLRKPGYRAEHREVAGAAHDDVVRVDLTPINGFEGVWVLPDGELRAFARAGESVDVFKLEAVAGPRTFYRRFALVDTPTGVAFANDENVTDERGASDPSCQIPHHVEYHYDPAADSLEVRPEEVETGRQNGHCYAKSRHMGSPIALVRADRDDGDTRHSRAPVGEPDKTRVPPPSKIPPSTRKPPPTKTVTKPTSADSVSKKKALDLKAEEAKKQQSLDNAPEPQAPNQAPPQAQQAPPTKGGKQAK